MPVFKMPSLGADMEAGKLVEWLIKPGDVVKRGDVVAVVETQKGAIEIECFEEGTVKSIDAELGATLPVGTPLATLEDSARTSEKRPQKATGEEAETSAEPAVPSIKAAPKKPVSKPDARPVSPSPGTGGDAPPASPAARTLAAKRGVDLGSLTGTGPGGAVLLADVEAVVGSVKQPAVAVQPDRSALDPAAMRAAIAAAMTRSKREIPHYYLTRTVDLQSATDWLAKTNETREPDARLLLGAVFVKATASAAAKVSGMNGHYGETGFRPSAAVHAGVAIALRGGGLIAPAIRDAETLGLDAVMVALRDLVTRTRTGRLRSSELTDGTITISSLGENGADAMAAVIFPPQVAILGFGSPLRRPWLAGDKIAARMTVTVTLSADHRVSDARQGAKLLAELDRQLQTPEEL